MVISMAATKPPTLVPTTPSPAPDLIERLASAPHWQTALQRARSLSRTDPRARDWVEAFERRATQLTGTVLEGGTTTRDGDGRFVIGSAGVAVPPELTAILRDALGNEGPVLRAAVFMLVGSAVRAPVLPAGASTPWDTFEKLRMIAKALPESRRDRWCDALPRSTTTLAGPAAMAGRRLLARGFNASTDASASSTALSPLPHPAALPTGAAVDLLLSALTFRACAELAEEAAGRATTRAA